jgi:hypothetical protein
VSHTTFKKRQKEATRVEKQLAKVAKRIERKNEDRPDEQEMTLEEATILRSQHLPIEIE